MASAALVNRRIEGRLVRTPRRSARSRGEKPAYMAVDLPRDDAWSFAALFAAKDLSIPRGRRGKGLASPDADAWRQHVANGRTARHDTAHFASPFATPPSPAGGASTPDHRSRGPNGTQAATMEEARRIEARVRMQTKRTH
jgi:hypothetical protein